MNSTGVQLNKNMFWETEAMLDTEASVLSVFFFRALRVKVVAIVRGADSPFAANGREVIVWQLHPWWLRPGPRYTHLP